MLDFTWKVFCMTGSVDTYLLMKEMENGEDGVPEALSEDMPDGFTVTQQPGDSLLEE